jgi:hypothetical protein
MKSKMKTQTVLLYALILVALWLMFARQADGFCGPCAMGALAA